MLMLRYASLHGRSGRHIRFALQLVPETSAKIEILWLKSLRSRTPFGVTEVSLGFKRRNSQLQLSPGCTRKTFDVKIVMRFQERPASHLLHRLPHSASS